MRLTQNILGLIGEMAAWTRAIAGLSGPGDAADPLEAPWNWHTQATVVVQGNPRFTAPYEGPRSLPDVNSVRETVSFDLVGGVRLWHGASAFADALVWQGFGLGNTVGLEAFPNGE